MISSFHVEFVAWVSIDEDLAVLAPIILIFHPMPYVVVILS